MEIFQTIWNALTTENQLVLTIIGIPMTILEAFITTLLFTSILNIKATKKTKAIYIFSFSFIAIVSNILIPAPFYTFLNVLACPILVLLIFKTSILKSILAEIIPYALFVFVNSILLNCFATIFNLDTHTVFNIPIFKLITCLIAYSIAFLLSLLFKHHPIKFTNMKKNNSSILFINLFVGIVALAFQSYLATIYSQYIPISTVIISLAILFVYFLISMYSLIRTNKLELTTKKLQEEQLYNKTLNILYDNIRGFKHDFQNIIQSLGGYISANNMEGLKNYYKDLLPDSLEINRLDVLNPDTINNPAVYSILTEKYHEADSFGITMNVEAFLNMQNINMKTYELTRILGILLDNAIDAAKNCDKKQINVSIRKDNKVNRQLFIIENTYTNKDVDLDRIFEKGYTSKNNEDKNSHGLGLWEIRKILKRNNNLNLFTTKTDEFFKQQFEIYC